MNTFFIDYQHTTNSKLLYSRINHSFWQKTEPLKKICLFYGLILGFSLKCHRTFFVVLKTGEKIIKKIKIGLRISEICGFKRNGALAAIFLNGEFSSSWIFWDVRTCNTIIVIECNNKKNVRRYFMPNPNNVKICLAYKGCSKNN